MMQERPTENSIWLWSGEPPYAVDDFRPWIEPYLLRSDRPRGIVLVCPGGGYAGRAAHEGTPVARRFNSAGIPAAVVQYRVAPNRHPAPLSDIKRAIRIVRSRSSEWGIDPAKIAVCGFSAGGHLAGSVGVHYDMGSPDADDPIERLSSRPDAIILCYPVISSGQFGHQGSFRNLLGENTDEEMLRMMSLELQVDENTPPAFLWHTADDTGVPVENSLLFATALSRNRVPFELHVYPNGRHGLGLAEEAPNIATWSELCCTWLLGMGW